MPHPAGHDPRYARPRRPATRGAEAERSTGCNQSHERREVRAMTWANFYLICFAVGLAFSLLSFFSAGVRWHLHLPHLPHAHLPAPGGHAGSVKGGPRAQSGQVSPFNFLSLAAFLAWFGGTGYLLSRFWTIWFAMGLAIALL